MRTIFVGGPGRSGTSFFAQRLGQHPEICTFPDIELKLFTEKNGLLDLHHSLVEAYSPNRGTVALAQFQRMINGLVEGQFGQPPLADLCAPEIWTALFSVFTAGLVRDGHPVGLSSQAFHAAASALLQRLATLAAQLAEPGGTPRYFLEKTPHSLLAVDFLDQLAPDARYIHVMRDPRSIAHSLRKMRWGPDRLETCCTWVESYCEAWSEVRPTIHRMDGRVEQLRIEDIAEAPHTVAASTCAWLGVGSVATLFNGARASVLNGWVNDCAAEDLSILQQRLGALARSFGYRDTAIGSTGLSSPSAALVGQ